MKYNVKIYIGLALAGPINDASLNNLKKILSFIMKIFSCDVYILAPRNLYLPTLQCKVLSYEDDESLFDFSRYHQILSSSYLSDQDILFSFNDTLGKGRKLNSGLFLYLLIAITLLYLEKNKKFTLFSPVDTDGVSEWICPYFFIGRVSFLKTLNFTNWRYAHRTTPKSVRYKLIKWLHDGWRGAKSSSKKQFTIKYKTLLLERNLVNNKSDANLFFMFSRSNPFRILNSFSI
jgi:hypothetical protein